MMQNQSTVVVLNSYGFEGYPDHERAIVAPEANKAFAEINCREELLALAEAALHGSDEFARVMRRTEHGSWRHWARWLLTAFFAHLYGEDCAPTDPYAQSYYFAFQTILAALRSLH